jgi:hypothetical protein
MPAATGSLLVGEYHDPLVGSIFGHVGGDSVRAIDSLKKKYASSEELSIQAPFAIVDEHTELLLCLEL